MPRLCSDCRTEVLPGFVRCDACIRRMNTSSTTGRCAACGNPVQRYGDNGFPLCADCVLALDALRAPRRSGLAKA
jgi:predicted amidophosphoribosyltransferase